ncbi:MAG TPA: ATP-binding SpoIIE family protein phosphatase [Pseudonocardiaceae bacterium]|nr:ATP-binding SpoIIE family protein phosphatase [Pseudonocardiaceae bacterium]
MTQSACLPIAEDVAWIHVEEPSAVGRARRVAMALANQLGFSDTRGAEIGVAVTEIGTNLRAHAQEGVVLVRSIRASTEAAVEIVAMDTGPGIANLDLLRRDGQSTAGTLGIGLGAVERLADSFHIASRPDAGTVLAARFHPGRKPLTQIGPDVAAGITRVIRGEEECGDAYGVRRGDGRLSLMMCDGSGHGPLAASAAQAAVRVFCAQDTAATPDDVVGMIHAALRGSRGGAVAVADIDVRAGRIRFAGLGNIAAAILGPGSKHGMISVPGVAGHQARTIRAYEYDLPADAVVVLHSDGLTERWTTVVDHDLLAGTPVLIAATLLRDAGTRSDDACVLVGKPSTIRAGGHEFR